MTGTANTSNFFDIKKSSFVAPERPTIKISDEKSAVVEVSRLCFG